MIDPSLLEGLAIQQSVGRGGGNTDGDTRLVQTALNLVPGSAGGSVRPLVVDGRCGEKTIAAIEGFERANGSQPHGLLKPGQEIVRRLGAFLGKSVPLAMQFALSGVVGTAAKSTPWQISGSAGFELSVGQGGLQGGYVNLIHDTEPGLIRRLNFGGLGFGVGMVRLGVSFSTASMPSSGTRLVRPATTAEPTFANLQGVAVILSLGAIGPMVGPSAAAFLFGVLSPTVLGEIQSVISSGNLLDGNNPVLSGLRTVFNQSRAAGVGYGAIRGSSNASAALYLAYAR